MNNDNFIVKSVKSVKKSIYWHEGGIYKFKKGCTIWDNGIKSACYKDVNEFFKIMNDNNDWFVEWKGYTIQDILLTDNFKDGQEFTMKLEDSESTYNVIYYKDILNHKYLKWKDKNEDLLLTDGYLTAKFYPVIPVKKSHIESIKALELIQQGKEVWCEIDDNIIKFNNPKTKKIQISHVLKGKWYVME